MVKHLDGIKQLLVIYPYVVEGGFTVVSKSPDTGLYDAHFGLILTTQPVCHKGYEGTDTRPPHDGSNRPMNEDARCTEPPTQTNARGAQNAPGAPRRRTPSGHPTWRLRPRHGQGDLGRPGRGRRRRASPTGSVAPPTLGEESWKWLFLQPLTTRSGVTEESTAPDRGPSAPPRTPCG